jgi:hypothetical protein
MFGNLLKLVLLGVIIAIIAVFARDLREQEFATSAPPEPTAALPEETAPAAEAMEPPAEITAPAAETAPVQAEAPDAPSAAEQPTTSRSTEDADAVEPGQEEPALAEQPPHPTDGWMTPSDTGTAQPAPLDGGSPTPDSPAAESDEQSPLWELRAPERDRNEQSLWELRPPTEAAPEETPDTQTTAPAEQ